MVRKNGEDEGAADVREGQQQLMRGCDWAEAPCVPLMASGSELRARDPRQKSSGTAKAREQRIVAP